MAVGLGTIVEVAVSVEGGCGVALPGGEVGVDVAGIPVGEGIMDVAVGHTPIPPSPDRVRV
jgi:hypothetical protein